MEELGKSQIVADFFYHLVAESEFKEAFSSHEIKIAYVNRDLEIPKMWEDDEWSIIYDKKSSKDQVLARENSLYVESRSDYSPQVPKDTISAGAAEKLLSATEKYLSDIRKMEYITERIGTKAFAK
jgi:AbiV family abortive infection protein